MNIRNIIFDLGGVLIDIEPEKSVSAFANACKLSNKKLQEIILNNRKLFNDYETGLMDSASFRKNLLEQLNHKMSDIEFDHLWNSMIQDVPEERMLLLEQLKSKYRMFLFSNINDIHAKRVDEILSKSSFASGLMGVFEKTYYSYLIQRRKPDPESFLHIIVENNLDPTETLFIDDTFENTESAKKLGVNVLFVERNNPRFEYLLENKYDLK